MRPARGAMVFGGDAVNKSFAFDDSFHRLMLQILILIHASNRRQLLLREDHHLIKEFT